MFPRPFLLPCPPPLQSPTRTVSFSHRAPFFQGIMQPALLDRRYRLARNHSTLITTPLGLPLFRLFSLYLWATQYLAKSWDLIESGERRAESVVARNPAPLPLLVPLAACAALVHCNRLLHALFVRPSFDLSATRVTLPRPGSPFTLRSVSDDLFILSGNISHHVDSCGSQPYPIRKLIYDTSLSRGGAMEPRT